MSYMIEGGGSQTQSKAKAWLYKYPEESHELLKILTNVIIDYLVEQICAGAQVLLANNLASPDRQSILLFMFSSQLKLVQLFESHAGALDHTLFVKFALPYIRVISKRVRDKLRERNVPCVPMVSRLWSHSGHSPVQSLHSLFVPNRSYLPKTAISF